jgi:hypothetical protein
MKQQNYWFDDAIYTELHTIRKNSTEEDFLFDLEQIKPD